MASSRVCAAQRALYILLLRIGIYVQYRRCRRVNRVTRVLFGDVVFAVARRV